MGRLRLLKPEQVCRILQENGFVITRQKGSHIVLKKQIDNMTWTTVVPNHRVVKVGTLSAIVRQSGLPRELFESDQ